MLEGQFLSLLGQLQPRPEIAAEFATIAAQIWDAHKEDTEKRTRELTRQLEEHKNLKSELLRAKLRGEVCQSDYEDANAEFSREIKETEKELGSLDSVNANRDSFLQFCELALVDIPQLWRTANEDQRRRVRTILFPDGILVGADRKISNPQNSTLFNVLAGMMAKKPQFSKVGCPPGIRTPIC